MIFCEMTKQNWRELQMQSKFEYQISFPVCSLLYFAIKLYKKKENEKTYNENNERAKLIGFELLICDKRISRWRVIYMNKWHRKKNLYYNFPENMNFTQLEELQNGLKDLCSVKKGLVGCHRMKNFTNVNVDKELTIPCTARGDFNFKFPPVIDFLRKTEYFGIFHLWWFEMFKLMNNVYFATASLVSM